MKVERTPRRYSSGLNLPDVPTVTREASGTCDGRARSSCVAVAPGVSMPHTLLCPLFLWCVKFGGV